MTDKHACLYGKGCKQRVKLKVRLLNPRDIDSILKRQEWFSFENDQVVWNATLHRNSAQCTSRRSIRYRFKSYSVIINPTVHAYRLHVCIRNFCCILYDVTCPYKRTYNTITNFIKRLSWLSVHGLSRYFCSDLSRNLYMDSFWNSSRDTSESFSWDSYQDSFKDSSWHSGTSASITSRTLSTNSHGFLQRYLTEFFPDSGFP